MRSERLREGGDSARLPSLVIAGIAQLVEHNLAKVGVAGSSPVSRSGYRITEEWLATSGTERRGVEQSGSSPGS